MDFVEMRQSPAGPLRSHAPPGLEPTGTTARRGAFLQTGSQWQPLCQSLEKQSLLPVSGGQAECQAQRPAGVQQRRVPGLLGRAGGTSPGRRLASLSHQDKMSRSLGGHVACG